MDSKLNCYIHFMREGIAAARQLSQSGYGDHPFCTRPAKTLHRLRIMRKGLYFRWLSGNQAGGQTRCDRYRLL